MYDDEELRRGYDGNKAKLEDKARIRMKMTTREGDNTMDIVRATLRMKRRRIT